MSRIGASLRHAAYHRTMISRLALAACALGAWTLAWGAAPEPPERLLRLSHVEGDAGVQSDGQRVYVPGPDERLAAGERVITPSRGRVELLLDASPIRLDANSRLRIDALRATAVQLALEHGTANVRLRELYEGDRFEVALPNVGTTLLRPGEYRFEARAA